MSKEEKFEITKSAKKFADWFELDITIKIFGVVIFSWHYPPQKN
jgi:hypothetical protein